MSERIEIIETVKLPDKREIRTKELIENPNEKDFLAVSAWIGICKIARIEITRPVVEIHNAVGTVVDYQQSEMTTIIIKLKGE
jgi:hypothetical protein